MANERITLEDNGQSAIMKLADGNPGALMALIELVKTSPIIDPDAVMGGLAPLLMLDSLGIYGSSIYVLHSDICGKSTPHMLAVLRAQQLGFITPELVKDASSRQDYSGREMLDIHALMTQVQERLPNFNRP